jgi:hypothetical protein
MHIGEFKSFVFEISFWLEAVAHTCNPSYSGGRDWENHGLTPTQANSLRDPTSTNKKLGMVAHACLPNCAGRVNRKIMIQTNPA